MSKKCKCHDQPKPEIQKTEKNSELLTENHNHDDFKLNSNSSSSSHFQDLIGRYETDDKLNTYSSYQPVTKFVGTDVTIVEQLGSLHNNESSDGLVLVGLHTCGDLAPTAIKIFLNDGHVKALCLVGCCYHLLSQSSAEETDITEKQACEG